MVYRPFGRYFNSWLLITHFLHKNPCIIPDQADASDPLGLERLCDGTD